MCVFGACGTCVCVSVVPVCVLCGCVCVCIFKSSNSLKRVEDIQRREEGITIYN